MFPELDMNGTTLTDDDYDNANGTDYELTTTATTTWSSTTVKDDSESTDGSTWHPDMSTEQNLNMTDYDDYVDYNGDADDYDGNATDYDYDNATTVDELDGSSLTTSNGADITSGTTTSTTTEATSEDTITIDTTTIELDLNTTDYTEYDYSGDDYDYDNATTTADTTTTDTTTTDTTTTETTTTVEITGDDDYDYINGTDYDYDNATTIDTTTTDETTTTDTTTTEVLSTTIDITGDDDYDYNNVTDYDYDNATTTETTMATSTVDTTTSGMMTIKSTTGTSTVPHTSTGGDPVTDSTDGSTWHPDMSTGETDSATIDTVTDGSTWHPDMSTEQGVTIDMDDFMNTTEPFEGDYDEGDDYDYNGNATTVVDDVDGSSFTTTESPTSTAEPIQSFTIELQVEIPLKVEFSEELANPESEEFQALENELFAFFTALLADQLANGYDLEIEVIVRPPAPVGRKRRSGDASVDVNVRLHNHFDIVHHEDLETYADLAEQTSQDIAASISANINEEMSNFESDYLDETADAVVLEAGATLDHVEGINCMFNNGKLIFKFICIRRLYDLDKHF